MKSFISILSIISLLLLMSCGKTDKPQTDTKSAEKQTEIRYAASKDGLRMRETPDVNGSKIGLIPDGEKLEFIEETGQDLTISGASGKWNSLTGWVFGGFLSKDQKSADGPGMPENVIGGYDFSGEIEPGNMPSRVGISKNIITKAIGGYVQSGKYCIIASFEKTPDGYIVKCSDRNASDDEIKKFDIEAGASKLKQVIIKISAKKIIIDNEPYKKR
jgi:hypothetical protein